MILREVGSKTPDDWPSCSALVLVVLFFFSSVPDVGCCVVDPLIGILLRLCKFFDDAKVDRRVVVILS